MSKPTEYVTVGFDPGGAEKFGWSILHWFEDERPTRFTCGVESNARGAMDAVKSRLEESNCNPAAIGIDAPLYWIDGEGERAVDKTVRGALLEKSKNSVVHVNSLRGGCLAQGMMLATLVRQYANWANVLVTEAHPAALASVYAITARQERVGANVFVFEQATKRRRCADKQRDLTLRRKVLTKAERKELSSAKSELHEIDATLAACAARIALEAPRYRWSDLVKEKETPPQESFYPWTKDPQDLHYFFPSRF